MPNVTAEYEMFSDLIAFLGIFKYFYMFENLYLHQTLTECVSQSYHLILSFEFVFYRKQCKDKK